jgi:hypothetical protein
MKTGFMVMIQKQSNNHRSGRAHNHQEQERRGRSGVQQQACSLFFFFFDVKGIVHCEFVPPNNTVNSDFYCDVLRCLRENLWQKRPELWRNHKWLFHHDNAPAHTSLNTTDFVTNNNMVMISLCFPNWKWNWRDDLLKQHLISKANRKWY